MKRNTKVLCEGAILIALALILGLIRLYRLPNGGSITLSMLPIILFAVRHGAAWGSMAGCVYGILDYIVGIGISIDWTTMVLDYVLANVLLGLFAGLVCGTKRSALWGTVLGVFGKFLCSYLVGVFVWGKWMPETFLGLSMTSPWFYSLLYNGLWALPDGILIFAVFVILYRISAVERYLTRAR